ncbi:hypothetical protein PG996_003247 [Apiospora saccharicola]|uniref:Carrier domain-containing protein n=1 Tax=Apiospora saccharicola TaxID=335842 RepID=A0ABR1W1Z1_9PEZI
MSRQSNRALPTGVVFSCSSVSEMRHKLRQLASSSNREDAPSAGIHISAKAAERPVILCFGGQVSTFIGLDRQLYDSVAVFRWHLDECDAAIGSAEGDLGSIYPDIFSREPVKDAVKLQTMLFALQYACAKTWADCGLAGNIAAVVGHSFGELTAICVAGILSVADAVKLVAGRAKLVRDAWGAEPGAMMALEADGEELVQELLRETNRLSDGSAAIACYNGPRSFTIAGTTRCVDAAAEVAGRDARFSAIKCKRLNVTNAFHSVLVDKVKDGLGDVGKGLTFHDPVIPVEHSTRESVTSRLDWTFVPSHMRNPVFFDHAVQRLADKYPNAIFLEAGSASTITIMAARALAQRSTPMQAHFQAMSLTGSGATEYLTDATVALWKQGLKVCFWPHHARQAREYTQLLLPPYQFDKAGRHWLEMKSPAEAINQAAEALIKTRGLIQVSDVSQTTQILGREEEVDPRKLDLFTFVGYQDGQKKKPRFRVNTQSDKYNHFFAGHIIAQTAPICPATLESDMAIEALFSLHPEWKAEGEGLSPGLRKLVNHSPICADPSRAVYIDFEALDHPDQKKWSMKMVSVNPAAKNNNDKQTHVEAQLHFRSPADADYLEEFARLERLVSHRRCQELLALGLDDGRDDIDVLRGRNVYRAFRDIVDYPELYRGVRAVVGRGNESAGIVHKRHQGQTWVDVPLSDSFSQVGGMWVNLMSDDLLPAGAGGRHVHRHGLRGLDALAPTGAEDRGPPTAHTRKSDKEYTTDVFVFDAEDGRMTEAMLGLQYGRVSQESMRKMLTRLTKDESVLRSATPPLPLHTTTKDKPSIATQERIGSRATETTKEKGQEKRQKKKEKKKKKRGSRDGHQGRKRDLTEDVRELVASVSGIEASDFTLDTEMADLGIDSLMGMELAREVGIVFNCEIDQAEQMEATTLRKFVACVENAIARAGGGDVPTKQAAEEESEMEGEEEEEEEEEDDDSSSSSNEGLTFSPASPDDGRSNAPTPNSSGSLSSDEKSTNHNTAATKGAQRGRAIVSNLALPRSAVLESFGEVKMRTDEMMRAHGLDTIHKTEIAGSNRLCTALVVEALEQLGMPLCSALPGQELDRVPFLPQHRRLMECVYTFLERDARLVDAIDSGGGKSGGFRRTHIAAPRKSSEAVLEELLATQPGFAVPNRMTHYAGQRLADVLSGTTDGIRVIFGTPQGRELVQAMYCDHTFNNMNYQQMRDVVGHLVDRLQQPGRDTEDTRDGGRDRRDDAGVGSFLGHAENTSNARRTFGAKYPFMKFAVHDIEKPPADEHRGQHIVLASNAVHATHSLVESARHIRQALRPDGFLMLLEMTEVVPFVDLVFGLLEGWWLFDDGRAHAVVPAEHWERELQAAGFGHVDWTDGHLPENAFQKVIMAMASGPPEPHHLPKVLPGSKSSRETPSMTRLERGDISNREVEAEGFVTKYTQGWDAPELGIADDETILANPGTGAVVIVTGATGSLGAHLVQQFAEQRSVSHVVCINRPNRNPVEQRQDEAFRSRGIDLSPGAREKLRFLETDTSKPTLGLSNDDYAWLSRHGTHILHNAWPMSGTRPLQSFEPQFQTLRNLLDLARAMATTTRDDDDEKDSKNNHRRLLIGFQLVSSIGVVGYAGEPRVLERRVPLSAVLPGGYAEAKWVCERMLDATLHRYPQRFRAMAARPGQIAGSSSSGYWNPVEHFAFLVKSAQALRAWPDLRGRLQWLPVDRCARVMAELLLPQIGENEDDHEDCPIYHIDNPVGQPWEAMTPVLAAALGIPSSHIIPFQDWIQRVRRSPLSAETENPAARLVDFLEFHFQRMSCGGLVLDTQQAQRHSKTMAQEGPVSGDVAECYITSWKEIGFLFSL